jgi:hypothetical protein
MRLPDLTWHVSPPLLSFCGLSFLYSPAVGGSVQMGLLAALGGDVLLIVGIALF